MVGELWDTAAKVHIDEDLDEEHDLLDEEMEAEDDVETWQVIRHIIPNDGEAGRGSEAFLYRA